ncbi:hypothetical protein Pint_03806 [Pistacia integerrima]|uniref:Uncharacterized protein n=1 Tax=Pistacia integerrima TaxID=434235 RepID=A0ACC0Z137_9ROSI|nr:hypothetical protein Pint_03806 [Pistacia integerrima]
MPSFLENKSCYYVTFFMQPNSSEVVNTQELTSTWRLKLSKVKGMETLLIGGVLGSFCMSYYLFNRNDCRSQKTQGEGNERRELSKMYSHSIPCINIDHKFVYHPYEEE